MDVERAADRDFCKGLAYVLAARRMEAADADELTCQRLRALAESYRERGQALMMGDAEAPVQR